MFVGVERKSPKVIRHSGRYGTMCCFIDKTDAVGRQRGAGIAGGNDEREQTLNQILTNMDGFSEATGIIVVAAK